VHPQIDQLEAFGPVFFPYHSGFPFYFSKALDFLAPRLVQCQLSTFARSQESRPAPGSHTWPNSTFDHPADRISCFWSQFVTHSSLLSFPVKAILSATEQPPLSRR
jgi:hypothetical protein